MELLYELMKQSLKHFGLRFSDMHKVRTRLVNGTHLRFEYGDQAVDYVIPN
jgi:hypothetical protein